MKSILFSIETIYCNMFKCNDLRIEKLSEFFFFFFNSQNLDPILKIFKKNLTLIADVFSNLRTTTNVVRWMSKKSCLRGRFDK